MTWPLSNFQAVVLFEMGTNRSYILISPGRLSTREDSLVEAIYYTNRLYPHTVYTLLTIRNCNAPFFDSF